MSNDKNAIIALLSAGIWSNRDQIKALQSSLHNEGFTNNSERYPNPDGVAGRLTRSDVIDFIEQNPEALLSLSEDTLNFFYAQWVWRQTRRNR